MESRSGENGGMRTRLLLGITSISLLLAFLLSADFLRLRWCHANAFAGQSHADWRTAFLGDSLTQLFQYPATNLGFIGATTGDLRGILHSTIRCRCYHSIVILAGTNDVLEHVPLTRTVENLDAMIAQASEQGLKVYVATVPPIYGPYMGRSADVDALNVQIKTMVERRRVTLLDYHAALVGHPEFFWDGVHITKEGYGAIMRVLQGVQVV